METVRGREREDGSRWPYWLLWALAIASAVGAYLIWRAYLSPLVTSVLKESEDEPDMLGLAILLPLLGLAAVAGTGHPHQTAVGMGGRCPDRSGGHRRYRCLLQRRTG